MNKIRKLTTIAVACVCVLGITIGTYIMKQNTNQEVQGISTVSYDNSNQSDYADQIASLVNKERASYGLKPVKMSPKLTGAANIRAKEIKQSFSHTRPDGSSCFTAITEAGITYRSAAENIAYGQKSPEAVMTAWMNSSGHRANILNANMEYIGVGVYYSGGTYYWTQFFAVSNDLSFGSYLPDESSATTTPKIEETIAPETTNKSETTKPDVATPPETQPESEPEITTSPKVKLEPEVTTNPKTDPKPAGTTIPEATTQPEQTENTTQSPCITDCYPNVDCYNPSDCVDNSCETDCDSSYNNCHVTGNQESTNCTPNNSNSGNCNNNNSNNQNSNCLDWILPWLTNNCDSSNNNSSGICYGNNSLNNCSGNNGLFIFGNQNSNCPINNILDSLFGQNK